MSSYIHSFQKNKRRVLELEIEKRGLESALQLLAHEIVRDDNDQITDIDLSKMNVHSAGIERLGTLKKLKRLKIEGAVASIQCGQWEALPKLTQLESLSISKIWVSEEMLRSIGQMPNLKRIEFESIFNDVRSTQPLIKAIRQKLIERNIEFTEYNSNP